MSANKTFDNLSIADMLMRLYELVVYANGDIKTILDLVKSFMGVDFKIDGVLHQGAIVQFFNHVLSHVGEPGQLVKKIKKIYDNAPGQKDFI